MKRRTVITWGVSGLVVVAAVAALVRPARIPVDVVSADVRPLRVTVDEDGWTRLREPYTITAPFAGRLERMSLREGDAVRAGAVVARLSPVPLDVPGRDAAEARVRQTDAAAEAARAAVLQARADEERLHAVRMRTDSLPASLTTPEARDNARLAHAAAVEARAAAEARADAAAHEAEIARAALAGVSARPLGLGAPAAGRVLRIASRSERVVAAGEPLLEIGNPDALEIVADLLSTDAVLVGPGAAVIVDGWGGPPLAGRVRLVEPSGFTKISALGVEEQRVNVIADFAEPGGRPRSLGDRFRVMVHVVVWQRPDALVVPASALARQGERWTLFVVENARAHRRVVSVGHRTPFEAEIVEGVAKGDLVVKSPGDRVEDGARVSVQRPAS